MRKRLFLLAFLFLAFPGLVFAHGSGFPPFFKINGMLANASLFSTGGFVPSSFVAPQDEAPQSYLVGEAINFQVDTSLLEQVFSKDIVPKIQFSWDFGDSSTAGGLANAHAYSKPGSYILTILANVPESGTEPQLAESVQIDILPNRDYKLPKAVITVNGKKIEDPLKESLNIDLNKEITLDASESVSGSSKIVEYGWDFDDGKTSKSAKSEHRYKLPQYYASPGLYVKDENGFISYTFVNLTNSGKNDPNNPDFENSKEVLGKAAIALGVLLVVLVVGYVIFKKSSHKRKKSEAKE